MLFKLSINQFLRDEDFQLVLTHFSDPFVSFHHIYKVSVDAQVWFCLSSKCLWMNKFWGLWIALQGCGEIFWKYDRLCCARYSITIVITTLRES